MSYYVIKRKEEPDERSRITQNAELEASRGRYGTVLNIQMGKVSLHLDSLDTDGLKRLLEDIER